MCVSEGETEMKKYTNKAIAFATAGLMMGQAGIANATNPNFTNMTTNVVGSVQDLPNLISIVCYIAGLAFGVFGIFKLKEHVENPGQVKLKDAIIRLAVAGLLLSLPFLLSVMTNTFSDGSAPDIDPSNLAFSAAAFT